LLGDGCELHRPQCSDYAYDATVKQINCVCGYVVKGEDDDELWTNAQEHLGKDHPDLVGHVSRADILAQAEEISRDDES